MAILTARLPFNSSIVKLLLEDTYREKINDQNLVSYIGDFHYSLSDSIHVEAVFSTSTKYRHSGKQTMPITIQNEYKLQGEQTTCIGRETRLFQSFVVIVVELLDQTALFGPT